MVYITFGANVMIWSNFDWRVYYDPSSSDIWGENFFVSKPFNIYIVECRIARAFIWYPITYIIDIKKCHRLWHCFVFFILDICYGVSNESPCNSASNNIHIDWFGDKKIFTSKIRWRWGVIESLGKITLQNKILTVGNTTPQHFLFQNGIFAQLVV